MPGLQITVAPGRTILDKKLVRQVLRAAGQEIARKARQMIRAGGATKKRAAKRASAPGTPPVSRTGELARGIKVRVWRSGDGLTVKDMAQAKGAAFYALFLEKGAVGGQGSGRKGVKGQSNKRARKGGKRVTLAIVGRRVLPPHPFMEPALEQTVNAGLSGRVQEALLQGMAFRKGK